MTWPYIWDSEAPLAAGSSWAVADSPFVHTVVGIAHYIEVSAEDTVNRAVKAGYSRFVVLERLKNV